MESIKPPASARTLVANGVDALAFGAALALPWSTSVASVCIVLTIILLPFSVRLRAVIDSLRSAAGGTPVLLVIFAAVGMAWSSATWSENLGAWDSYAKLLLIPPLLVHFRASPYGARVLIGFLVSCCALLLTAWIVSLWSPPDVFSAGQLLAPVKNPATQIREFLLAGFAFACLAVTRPGARLIPTTIAMYLAAAAFLASALYMASFTHALEALTTLAVLIAVLGWHLRRLPSGLILTGCLAAATLVWALTPQASLRLTLEHRSFLPGANPVDDTWRGGRGEFWQQSIGFIREAPVIGHGTGSTQDLFRAAKLTGSPQNITINPHQQTLAVGLQLGACGMLLLWIMWLAHLRHFFRPHPLAWAGLLVVGQTIAGALFDSLLFDFTEGWLYVLAVGIVGGMVMRPPTPVAAPAATPLQ